MLERNVDGRKVRVKWIGETLKALKAFQLTRAGSQAEVAEDKRYKSWSSQKSQNHQRKQP